MLSDLCQRAIVNCAAAEDDGAGADGIKYEIPNTRIPEYQKNATAINKIDFDM